MKIISIDDRLKDIASLVDNCNCIADIGTDHAYLPIYLILNGQTKKAYASDVAIGPLNKAKENIVKYNLTDSITPILSNGLEKIPNDVDCVIMAGMGANLIMEIISKKKFDYKLMILQANLNVNYLREFLMNNNYKIIDEKVSYTNKKYYEIIKVTIGKQDLTKQEIKYGPINLMKRSPLFIEKWQNILNNYKRIISDFKGSNGELNRLNNEISDIENMLNN